jgi:hypothetical protein
MAGISIAFFLLMVASTIGLAAIAWTTRFIQYPLLLRGGRRQFTLRARSLFSLQFMLSMPLMAVELTAAIGFAVSLPARVSAELSWAGLALLAICWGVTLFVHRPAARALSRSFDPIAMRRLLCAQWMRSFGWSFRAVTVLMMLLQLLRS